MDCLHVVYLLNEPFIKEKETFSALLPQAVVYAKGQKDLQTMADELIERLKVNQIGLNQLAIHYIVDLSEEFTLNDLKALKALQDLLPDFTHNTTYVHCYIQEKNSSCQKQLASLNNLSLEDLHALADFYFLSSNVDSNHSLTDFQYIVDNMVNTILSLPSMRLTTGTGKTPFLTVSSKTLKWSADNSLLYYQRGVLTDYDQRLTNQLKTYSEGDIDQAWHKVEALLTKQIEATLASVFSEIKQEVYQGSLPIHHYEKGGIKTLREAEKLVFGQNLSTRYSSHYKKALSVEEQEKFVQQLQPLLDDVRNSLVTTYYPDDSGNVLSMDNFFNRFLSFLQNWLEHQESVIEQIKERAESSWDDNIELLDDKFGFIRKGPTVEDKLRVALSEKIFAPYDSVIKATYFFYSVKELKCYLENYTSIGKQIQVAIGTHLNQLPQLFFPQGLEREIQDCLDQVLLKAEQQQLIQWSKELYFQSEAKREMASTLSETLAQVTQNLDQLDLEMLLTKDDPQGVLSKKVISYFNGAAPYPLRTSRSYVADSHYTFVSDRFVLAKALKEQYNTVISLEDSERILTLSVFKDISLTDLLAYRYEGGEL